MNIYENLNNKDIDLFELVMSDDDLETDLGFGIIEKFKERCPGLEQFYSIESEDSRLRAIDKMLEHKSIYFVSQSNGCDDLIFKVIRDEDHLINIRKYGYPYAENYVPISELPNLWDTPGFKIDQSVAEYAERAARPLKYYIRSTWCLLSRIEAFILERFFRFIILLFAILCVIIYIK